MRRQETSSQIPEISVVVPVYRNADTLEELHRRLCKTLEELGVPFEILFVDDACPEGSREVLTRLARRDSRIALLSLERNVGQHRAVMAALAGARGKRVVVMDADLQDPPEAIPALLDAMRRGYAAVFAGRRGRYESTVRLLTSRLFKRLLSLLCGVPPDAGLYVAMSRELVDRLLAMQGPSPFVVAMIGCAGLPMASLPVVRSPRPDGRSAYSFGGRLRSGWSGMAWALTWKRRKGRGIIAGGEKPEELLFNRNEAE